MYKNYLIAALLFLLALAVSAAEVKTGRKGLEIIDNAGSVFGIENVEIVSKLYKKIVLSGEYSPAGMYPGTETYERVYTFAVPDGAKPEIFFSVSGIRTYRTSELVPAKTFSKSEDGINSEVYLIPEKRIEKESEHAEIIRFGHYKGMELYRLVVRPLVIRGEAAEFADRTFIKISFSEEFENEGTRGIRPAGLFENSILNLEYALANPVRRKKAIELSFLDRGTQWVRIKVKDEGMYRITGAHLRSLGIDISAVLCGRIKVFSSAGKDIDQSPVAAAYHGASQTARSVTDINGDGFFNDNDYIVFYAVSAVARDGASKRYYYNKHSDHTYYWIDTGLDGVGEYGKDMPELSVPDPGLVQDISIFKKHAFSESRNSNYFTGESFLWFNKAIDPFAEHTISFQMKDFHAADSVIVRIRHSNEITNSSRMNYTVNGDVLTETVSLLTEFEKKFEGGVFIPNSLNTVTMRNTGTSSAKYYNGFEIIYSGTVKAGAADEYFYSEATPGLGCRINMEGSAGKQLFDITDPLNVKTSVLTDDFCIVNSDGVNSYMLFSGNYRTPVSVSVYDNTHTKSLHSRTSSADMVIISPQEFYGYFSSGTGKDYINSHLEYDNGVNSILVVSIDSLSNEFGRGYQEPAATRNFIRYASENWGTEFILLAGDGNYFIKNDQTTGEKNLIYPSDPNYSALLGSGSDDFYANLFSASPAQNVSIGRFTVSNISELNNVVTKTVSFMKNTNIDNQRAKILLVGDDERSLNGGGTWEERMHIRNTETLIAPAIPGYYYTDKLYMTEYPFEYSPATGLYLKPRAEQDLIRKLNGGVNFFCYVGHGAPMQLAHEKIFTPASFSKVSNFERYYFMFGATCSFGVFTNPQTKYLAEQMLLNPAKGSIGLINSVTAVFSTSNEYLVQAFLESAFADDMSKLTVGEALKEAKNIRPSSGNSSKFMLFGDPALKLFADKNTVSSSPSVELYTLRPDSISSELVADSVVMTEKNGTLNTLIVDSAVKRAYYNNEHWDSVTDTLRYTLPGKIILSAKSSVSGGRSVTRFILPKDLTYGENKGKVLFYGRDLEGGEFTGSINSVTIRGDGEVLTTDSIPPKITISYNSENYLPGDPIGESPLILARIEDENGINTSGGIGHKILMEIDGTPVDVTPYFSYDIDGYKSGFTSYQFVDLPHGSHNIKVSAWDNFNNYNEKVESFTVIDEGSKTGSWIGNLLNHPNPMKKKGTTFGFTVNLPSELRSYSITVYTINGRKVKTLESTLIDYSDQFQSVFWDGRDADGDIPANGVYIYILRAKFNDGKTVNKKGKLIFAR